jgi:hypothetical protein
LNTPAGRSAVFHAKERGKEFVGVTGGELLKEVLRAEGRAEKILKKNWQAVEAIAERLRRSESRRITKGRLPRLAGNNFAKTDSSKRMSRGRCEKEFS